MKHKLIIFLAICVMVFSLNGCVGVSEIQQKINEGNEKLEEKDYQGAIDSYKEALEFNNEDVQAKCGLAAAYMGMDNFEEAEVCLSEFGEEEFDAIQSETVRGAIDQYTRIKSLVGFPLDEDNEKEFFEALRRIYQIENADEKELDEIYNEATDSKSGQNDGITEGQTENTGSEDTGN